MWLYSQAGGEISFRSCKSVKKRFSGSGEKKVVTNGKARHGTLSVAVRQDAAVWATLGSVSCGSILYFYISVSEWRTCSQCSANLTKMMKVVFGYFIKLLLKGPHPRVTMNKFKVAIPLVMKPGIEDIPVPGSFVERTGEFHRAGLVVKLFGRSEEHTSELQSRGHLVC